MARLGGRKLGDVVAIPLTDGSFVAGRLYEDSIGIYKKLFTSIPTLTDVDDLVFAFFGYCVDVPIRNGEWPIIGRKRFMKHEDPWYPPTYRVIPSTPPKYFIDHGLESRKATLEEITGLQEAEIYARAEYFVKEIERRVVAGDFS